MSGRVSSYQPVNPALSSLLGELRTPVNASRIPLDARRINGKRDGMPVIPVSERSGFHTGIASVDKTTEKVGSFTQFVPQAIQNTFTGTFKGSLYGTVVGLIIGLATQWRYFLQIVTLRPPLQAMAVLGGIGLLGSFAGAGIGFLQSVKRNLQDLKGIMLGQPSTARNAKKASRT